MKTLVFILGLLGALPSFSADLTPLFGEYPILVQNGDASVTGLLKIHSKDNLIGYEVSPINMGSNPVYKHSYMTPLDQTEFHDAGATLVQKYEGDNESITIEYHQEDGYLVVALSFCGEEVGCGGETLFLGTGKAPGTEIDPREFISRIEGNYEVQLAGGNVPKEENKFAIAMAFEEELLFTSPYCPPGGELCDPGYNYVNFESDKIYEKKLGRDTTIYTIVIGTSAYYRWIQKPDKVILQNLQYRVDDARAVLEHEMIQTP